MTLDKRIADIVARHEGDDETLYDPDAVMRINVRDGDKDRIESMQGSARGQMNQLKLLKPQIAVKVQSGEGIETGPQWSQREIDVVITRYLRVFKGTNARPTSPRQKMALHVRPGDRLRPIGANITIDLAKLGAMPPFDSIKLSAAETEGKYPEEIIDVLNRKIHAQNEQIPEGGTRMYRAHDVTGEVAGDWQKSDPAGNAGKSQPDDPAAYIRHDMNHVRIPLDMAKAVFLGPHETVLEIRADEDDITLPDSLQEGDLIGVVEQWGDTQSAQVGRIIGINRNTKTLRYGLYGSNQTIGEFKFNQSMKLWTNMITTGRADRGEAVLAHRAFDVMMRNQDAELTAIWNTPEGDKARRELDRRKAETRYVIVKFGENPPTDVPQELRDAA